MPLIRSEFWPQLKALTLLDINTHLYRVTLCGKDNDNFSIVMDFSDDGDLYQKIMQHQKDQTTFA